MVWYVTTNLVAISDGMLDEDSANEASATNDKQSTRTHFWLTFVPNILKSGGVLHVRFFRPYGFK